MINPMRCVFLNGQWFNYLSESYREQVSLRNSVDETQGGRALSVQGKSKESFNITIPIDNTYNVFIGTSVVGSTTWLGVSRLQNLKNILGGTGASMPILFINPYGATFSVVPSGTLDINIFNPSNPRQEGVEFRVSITLDSI